jgi:hypothetical protein
LDAATALGTATAFEDSAATLGATVTGQSIAIVLRTRLDSDARSTATWGRERSAPGKQEHTGHDVEAL